MNTTFNVFVYATANIKDSQHNSSEIKSTTIRNTSDTEYNYFELHTEN